jgi:TonB family protein
MNELVEIAPKRNLLSSSVLSALLHAAFFSLFFITRPTVSRFEGYPTLLPVELVSFGPVSFNAPEAAMAQAAEETESAVETAPEPAASEPKPEDANGITVESVPTKKETPKPEKLAGNTEPKKNDAKKAEPNITETPAKVESAAGFGGGGGVRLDVREFPFSYYLAALRSRIQSNWEPPYQAARSSISRKALIYFKVQRNGEISDVVIESGSGDRLFDQAALRAVTLANPLPPLPFDFPERALGVHFEFEQGF